MNIKYINRIYKKVVCMGMVTFMSLCLVGCGSQTQKGPIQGAIHIYTRDSSSGTREAFEKGAGFAGKLVKTAIEVSSNDDMAAKVGADRNGIGYVSLSTDFKKNGVKPIQYDGIVASSATVLDGSYKLQRPFNFVTRAKGDFESKDQEQLIAAFLDFLQNSIEGNAVVKKNGGEVDLSKSTAWENLAPKYPVVDKDNSKITINTGGSTSVDKTIKAALETFMPMAGNFKFTMNQTGSGDAVSRTLGKEKDGPNSADIGFASRSFEKNGSEDIHKAMASGTYCMDAVVTIVNQNNHDVDNLNQEQLKRIFSGDINKWEDVK